MATNQASKVLHHLRRAVLIQQGPGLTDGQLLECFLDNRDEAAFAALVKRHRPMVWGVCRRLLDHHDAEDAFQAALLVLFRKAASIQPREMLANWLYGVARQTALQARRTMARRRAKETPVANIPEPAVEERDVHDLQPLFDQELTHLPEKYRAVIILCDLEGQTRKETARQLGCPEGTVAGRLARARVMLARRLARHGLVVSGGTLAAVLAESAASAGMPVSAVSSATLFVGGVISPKVAALAEGVLQAMLLNKLKAVLMTVVVLVAAAGGSFSCWTAAAQDGEATPPDAERRVHPQPRSKAGQAVVATLYQPTFIEAGEQPATLRLTWKATGRLAPRPIALFYAEPPGDSWRPIGDGLDNSGRHEWVLPRGVPDKVFLRISVAGEAGEVTVTDTPEPVTLRMAKSAAVAEKGRKAQAPKVEYEQPFDLPSGEEVLKALPKGQTLPHNPHIKCELVSYRLEAPRFYPNVGPAQLSMAHFKCSITGDQGDEVVVFIDKNRLIPSK